MPNKTESLSAGTAIPIKITESQLQQSCIKWFRLQYPQHAMNLFSIPNEGKRAVKTSARMKAEGILSGAWDMFLAVPNKNMPGSHGLFIEMKVGKNTLTKNQREFEFANESAYSFLLCRSLDEFVKGISKYLSQANPKT